MKLFAVIDHASINMVTGYRTLVGERFFDKVQYDLVIEVRASTCGSYVPVDDVVARSFPEVKPAFISKLIIQY